MHSYELDRLMAEAAERAQRRELGRGAVAGCFGAATLILGLLTWQLGQMAGLW